jgi:hypothetical protein
MLEIRVPQVTITLIQIQNVPVVMVKVRKKLLVILHIVMAPQLVQVDIQTLEVRSTASMDSPMEPILVRAIM